ncbi:hypothetical protein SNE40_011936 [Patella caerulea]|uniref:Uncharacterized protein n=1 Tax=Patella caerulea TaxID=87958 RepID=A0AAN8JPC3_PATCE
MKQEFYDLYKKRVTPKPPTTKSKSTRVKKDPTPYQKWSKSLKKARKGALGNATTRNYGNEVFRQPLTDVNNCEKVRHPFTLLTSEVHTVRNKTHFNINHSVADTSLRTCDVKPKFILQAVQMASPTSSRTTLSCKKKKHMTTASRPTVPAIVPMLEIKEIVKVDKSISNSLLPCDTNVPQTVPYVADQETQPFCTEKFTPGVSSFKGLVVENSGKVYAESSDVTRGQGFLSFLLSNDAVIDPEYSRDHEIQENDPGRCSILDGDLAYTLSESNMVVDMGHMAFYDIHPSSSCMDTEEKNIAENFFHQFENIQNLIYKNKQEMKARRVYEQKRVRDSETVYDGNEPWLNLFDLMNEVDMISSQSDLIYTEPKKDLIDGDIKETVCFTPIALAKEP